MQAVIVGKTPHKTFNHILFKDLCTTARKLASGISTCGHWINLALVKYLSPFSKLQMGF